MSFAEASAISGGPGAWTASLAPGWDIFGVTNGGYLTAISTKAMEASSGGRTLLSVSAHFLNAASPAPVSIDVSTLKEGRMLSTMRSTMLAAGKPLMVTTGVFRSGKTDGDKELVIGQMPRLPDPEDCVPAKPSDSGPLPPPFTGKVDLRVHPDDAAVLEGRVGDVPRMRGWFRLLEDEPLDAHAVVLATDAFPPAIFNSKLPVGWTPTVDLTIQVRNPNPSGWLACSFSTRLVTGGMLEEDGEIWDQDGRLVALSRQLALVPR